MSENFDEFLRDILILVGECAESISDEKLRVKMLKEFLANSRFICYSILRQEQSGENKKEKYDSVYDMIICAERLLESWPDSVPAS